ncbi:acetate/propionate family kinase [Paraburkholderia dinghuensis]|uniref:Acetate kinase n=1 Tax=Paraburkholderia dinghuensis TaxID=2305225 RepID=A0A3N6M9Y3_9BURK|nr:acetate kinase [Paraburkholderia dinghuensis]RQH00594.1 acetate kinase [Paraburkholderia dinghuensis]
MSDQQPLVLVVNSGSSSVKFKLLPADGSSPLLSGIAESLCTSGPARLIVRQNGERFTEELTSTGHQNALRAILSLVKSNGWIKRVRAVGHRVVHGGERFTESARITPEVIRNIEACTDFAPLHNAANLLGIRACSELLPSIPQVAVFDTAFHQTMPVEAFTYAIPQRFYRDHGIRRYGFHGTSFRYVSERAVELLGLDPDDHGLVIVHLGNGASACAVRNGKSCDTTMGFTPLEGLVMGTRSGDLDIGAAAQIGRVAQLNLAGVEALLNRDSGLLGISELSSDFRTLEDAADFGDQSAELALDVFTHRVVRYIGALATSLTRFDGVIFTGGIGENSARLREMVLNRLRAFSFVLHAQTNRRMVGGACGRIDRGSHTQAWVIPTDEEAMIARDAIRIAGLHQQGLLRAA